MHRKRRAKIVATVGPASSSPDKLRSLFLAGVDTFRLNFSHGKHEDHAKTVGDIRCLEKEVGRPIGILQDLQGPKIRVGALYGGKAFLSTGQDVTFVLADAVDEDASIPLPHPEIFLAVNPGQELLIDDGRVRLTVTGTTNCRIDARVIVGGAISDRKGVNLPGTELDLSPLTAKDRVDLDFGLSLGVDWVALSFVQKPSDITEALALVDGRAGLIAKIEKPQALEKINDIVDLADGIMVARGDMGVELPHEDVPGRQKELVRLCRKAGKPVIVATQMLDSMVNSPTPTRAEASDVATAIYDGVDAVMLSAESASGNYPVEAVEMMDRIIGKTERHSLYRSIIDALEPGVDSTPSHAVADAAAEIAGCIGASAIVAFTSQGTTAQRIARRRPGVPVVAVTPNIQVARQLSMLWGACGVHSGDLNSYDDMTNQAHLIAVSEKLAAVGDLVVVVAGIPFGLHGSTNNLRIIQITPNLDPIYSF